MHTTLKRLAADAVLLAHFAWVLFAVFGGFLILLDRRWAWFHVAAVLWSSIVNLRSWTCPLTPAEQALRRAAGDSYDGGFVQHYIGAAVYPKGMPRQMELIAGVSIVAWNIVVYGSILGLAS